MILTSEAERSLAADAGLAGKASLDAIFLRVAESAPDRLALVDAGAGENPQSGGRRLTYAACRAALAGLVAEFDRSGLREDSVVAMQVANTAEAPLALLAASRLGWLAAPLSPAWGVEEVVRALRPLGARGVVASAQASGIRPADAACEAAAELFSVRHVMGFGTGLPDGVRPLSFPATAGDGDPQAMPPSAREHEAADHAALLAFDPSEPEHAVSFSTNQLVASGLLTLVEARVDTASRVLCTVMAQSLSGMAGAVMPWLLSGSTLILQQPFDEAQFFEMLDTERATHCVLPGPVFFALMQDRARCERLAALDAVILCWRRPSIVPGFGETPEGLHVVDLYNFGERTALARMREGGRALPPGVGMVTPSQTDAPVFCEIETVDGELRLRGPAVGSLPAGEPDAERAAADRERRPVSTFAERRAPDHGILPSRDPFAQESRPLPMAMQGG